SSRRSGGADDCNQAEASLPASEMLGSTLGVPHDAGDPLLGGGCGHEKDPPHLTRRHGTARPRARRLGGRQRPAHSRLRLNHERTLAAMATIAYQSTRDSAPPNVSDAFVRE